MRDWQSFVAITGLSIALTSAFAQPPKSSQAGKGDATTGDNVRITLPKYSADIPKGPNVEVYEKDCLLCHSARYVTMQPGFSRSTWEKEVKKMVDAYGASVPEADQSKIVDYLVAIRGVPDSKPSQNSR